MRVAILTGQFPKFSEAWLLDQAGAALEAGVDLVVVGEPPPERPIPHEQEARRLGLLDRAVYMPPLSCRLPVRVGRGVLRTLAGAATRGPRRLLALDVSRWGNPALTGQIESAARAFERVGRVDLVHTHHGGNAVLGAALRRMGVLRAPLLATFHGSDILDPRTVARHRGYRSVWDSVDRITTNSNALRHAVEALGAPPDRIESLPVGIRTADIEFRSAPPPDGAIRCVTVGRLIRLKGVDAAIDAMAHLDDLQPPVELHVVGDGEERPALERRAQERGVSDRVVFHGWMTREEVLRTLRESHLLVQPSRPMLSGQVEAQGVAPLEAQAIGLPVIVSDSGGLPETVDPGSSGLIVPPDDPGALAAAIRQIAETPERWGRMGEAGRRWVEQRFDAQALGTRLVAIYERLASPGSA